MRVEDAERLWAEHQADARPDLRRLAVRLTRQLLVHLPDVDAAPPPSGAWLSFRAYGRVVAALAVTPSQVDLSLGLPLPRARALEAAGVVRVHSPHRVGRAWVETSTPHRVPEQQALLLLDEALALERLREEQTLPGDPGPGRAAPADTEAVDAYAMEVALREVAALHPGRPVRRMPHGNPGFDVQVGPDEEPEHFYEVKGTRSLLPVFHLSERQRAFSAEHGARCTLLVVSGIDLGRRTHDAVGRVEGPFTEANAGLRPVEWRGCLVPPLPG